VSASFEPIRRSPLYQEIAQRLRELIVSGDLHPGDRMPAERQLAEMLGVSRTSIRQALAALQAVGLVDIRHGDGVYVRKEPNTLRPEVNAQLQTSGGVLVGVMEVREALEVQIARLAAARRTEADLDALRDAVSTMEQAGEDGDDPSASDEQFHAALAEAAGNAMLVDLMRQIAEPIGLTRRASLARRGQVNRSSAGHRRIIDAVAAGDEDAAMTAMRAHLQAVAAPDDQTSSDG